MNPTDLQEADPLRFLLGVLDLMPDPADATPTDLVRLAAAGRGCARRAPRCPR
jgi:hypothetical protein